MLASSDYLSNNYGTIKFKNVTISDTSLKRTASNNRAAPADDRPAQAMTAVAKKVAAAVTTAPAPLNKPDVAKSAVVQNFFKQTAVAKPKTSAASIVAVPASANIPASQPVQASQANDIAAAVESSAVKENVADDGEWNDQDEAYSTDKSNLKKR